MLKTSIIIVVIFTAELGVVAWLIEKVMDKLQAIQDELHRTGRGVA